MKYLSFDLEVHLDTLFTYHSVVYESNHITRVIFSNTPKPSGIYNNSYSLTIYSPVSESQLQREFPKFDPNVNILKKVESRNYKNKTIIREVVFFKCALSINQSYEVNNSKRNPIVSDCLPKIRIRNINFKEDFSVWLEPEEWNENPWFSMEGIDEKTVFDTFD